MQSYIRKLKRQTLLFFLPLALAFFLFLGYYVYTTYVHYQKSLYLERSIRYVQIVVDVVKNLQRERGLSVACEEQGAFCRFLSTQRKHTDEVLERYKDFLFTYTFPPIWQRQFQTIIDEVAKLPQLRTQVDKKKAKPLEVVHAYNRIIHAFIDSVSILEQRFIDNEFFQILLSFEKILQYTELNAQERALITLLLQQRHPDKKIYQEAMSVYLQEQTQRELLQKIMPPVVRIFFYDYIPPSLEKKIEDIKARILQSKQFDLLSIQEWWKVQTTYINRLFATQKGILQLIWHKKEHLKDKTFWVFVASAASWLMTLIGFLLFMRWYDTHFERVEQAIADMEFETRLFQVFAQFSETLLFVQDTKTLINTLMVLVDKMNVFDFLILLECSTKEIVATRHILANSIKRFWPKSLDAYIQQAIESRTVVVVHGPFDEPLLKKTQRLVILPILHQQKCEYLLILSRRGTLHPAVIEILQKMAEYFDQSLRHIEYLKKEKKLQKRLALLSQAFESQEAIAITDKFGNILKVNKAFEKITGYKESEVLGKNPSILKSGKHDKAFYQQMWDEIKKRGFWKGEIYNRKKDGTIYPEILSITAVKDDKGEIQNFVSHFFDISDVKKVQEELRKRAELDLLTELFNRKKLLEELRVLFGILKKEGTLGAFFFIDLDNFKYVNDSYGHDIGDKVLMEVAKRLKSLEGPSDMSARIAGDEFALVLGDLGKDEQIAIHKSSLMAQRLINICGEPVVIDGQEIEITYSVGIALFPKEFEHVDEVINAADIAMYSSKKSGKNTFCFYNKALDIESKQFLVMKQRIEEGMANGEFELFFQPKLRLLDTKVVSFEGLMRWRHDGKVLTPDHFLSYTKGNRLLYSLSDIALRQAFEMIEKVKEKNIKVAINLDASQIVNQHYIDQFLEKIASFSHPELLIVEITEDSLVENITKYLELNSALKELGVAVAIDDFGVGYSSLSYLREFRVDELKIDKSFILNLFENKNDQLVAKIIEISKIYEIKVTAEGVENAKAVEFLKEHGCDYVQGFYFSRPLPQQKALEMVL